MDEADARTHPVWVLVLPLVAAAYAGLEISGLIHGVGALSVVAASVLLLAAVFASVHHAAILAERIGEPVVSLVADISLGLGLEAEHVVLLVLALFVSLLTLGTGRTTVLQGGVHLVEFATFLMLAASP